MNKNMMIGLAACVAFAVGATLPLSAAKLPRAGAAAAVGMAPADVRACGYDSMRIMTFNICHCATQSSLSITDEDVRRTAGVIAAESPDFVCLQEVDDKTIRANGIDETARLAELTGMHGTFGKARDYQGGGYGVAILSKQEPLSVSTRAVVGKEARLLLICEFADFCVATIHLDNDKKLRLESIQEVRDELAAISKPVFIAGDWNDTPESDTLDLMREFVAVISPENGIRTFGDIDGDEYVIDYIAVDAANVDNFYVQRGYCVSNMVDGQGSSDHNPVIVDVVKRPAELRWVDESFLTTERTGAWSPSVAWDVGTWTAELGGDSVFTPVAPSGGNIATMTVTAAFDAVPMVEATPDETAHGAVWLGTNGCFQVWTKTGWVDVEANGVTPQTGVEYTFRFVFDYRYGTYSVSVFHNGTYIPLVQSVNRTHFPLAVQASCVSRVKFTGDGTFTSLLGEWAEKANGMRILLR